MLVPNCFLLLPEISSDLSRGKSPRFFEHPLDFPRFTRIRVYACAA